MEDQKIVELFFSRSEYAISETDLKYGRYCKYISQNILCNREDAEECVNDAYLDAWRAIPPHAPQNLKAFQRNRQKSGAVDRLNWHWLSWTSVSAQTAALRIFWMKPF